MGTNWIVSTTFMVVCLINASALAQNGVPQPNYYQQQAAAQYQRQMEMAYAQAQQQAGFHQYGQHPHQGYQPNGFQTQQVNQLPAKPHAEVQAQYANQRLLEERMYAQERYAAQQQYQPVFPRRLPVGRNASFRMREEDIFQQSRYRNLKRQNQEEDPFGEREVPPPAPQQTDQPQDPPQQDQEFDAFADPPPQDQPQQPVPQDVIPEDPSQQQTGPEQPVPQEVPENPMRETEVPVVPGRDNVTAPEQTPEYPPGAITPEMFDPQDDEKKSIVTPDQGLDSPPAAPMNQYDTTPSYQPYPPSFPRSYSPPQQVQPGYPVEQYPQYPAPTYGWPQQAQPTYPQPAAPVQPPAAQSYFDDQYSAVDAGVYDGVICNDTVVQPTRAKIGLPQFGCPNFYLSVFGGGVFLNDFYNYQDTISLDAGGAVGVALGQRHGCNLRSDIEFTYRGNGISGSQHIGGYNQLFIRDLDGEINAYSFMTNFYWEFMKFPRCCFKPYVGAGIGFVGFDTKILDDYGSSLIPKQHDTTSFAYQFIGGVNYKATCHLDLFVEYRYFAADSYRIDNYSLWPGGKYEYQTSNIFGGLRWKF